MCVDSFLCSLFYKHWLISIVTLSLLIQQKCTSRLEVLISSTTMTTTTVTYASKDSGSASIPEHKCKSLDPEERAERPTLPERAPRIGFTQLLPLLVISWISNCNNTGVDILPTAIARVVQALVLVGLLNVCEDGESTSWSGQIQRRPQVSSFFVQALCVFLVIDLLRLDPSEAQALVSTAGWRDRTANLFGR